MKTKQKPLNHFPYIVTSFGTGKNRIEYNNSHHTHPDTDPRQWFIVGLIGISVIMTIVALQ